MTRKSEAREPRNRRLRISRDSVLRHLDGAGVSVAAVVEGMRSEGYKTDESVQALLALERDNKVSIEEARPYSSLSAFALSPLSIWLWAALGAVALSVALISVTSGVVIYLRYVFGSVLVLFLPGYALIESLYPKRDLDELTRFALSIGLSLAVTPLTGLVLNFTPFGIRLLPVAISLAGITVALLFVALTRKHAYYKLAKGVL